MVRIACGAFLIAEGLVIAFLSWPWVAYLGIGMVGIILGIVACWVGIGLIRGTAQHRNSAALGVLAVGALAAYLVYYAAPVSVCGFYESACHLGPVFSILAAGLIGLLNLACAWFIWRLHVRIA